MEKIKELYLKYKEIINYLIFGVLTTIVSLAVYFVCVLTFLNPDIPIQLQIANILSWFSGVVFAYFTNRKFVFESKNKNKKEEASKFLVVRIVTLFLDMFNMWLGVTILHINDKFMKIVSIGIGAICNYLLSKIFVFKKADKK